MNQAPLFNHNFTLIAHRGASAQAPENTFAAINRAKTLGATWVEFDVMLSADDIPVVFHDETLERTTNGHGKVADKPYLELEKLDAGSWFADKFKDEKIPTLADLLTLLKCLQLNFNIEIKSHDQRAEQLTRAILQLLEQYEFQQANNVLISSFSRTVLAMVRQLHASIPLGMCFHEWEPDHYLEAKRLNCTSIHLHDSLITADRVHHIKSNHDYVLSFTIDDKARAQQLHRLGVDAIFTNDLTLFNS